MVPPPDSTGDEFPDFESMTPEEQMAWLESLARRQGASSEEFTTAADYDIPELPEDTVVDEPGYVPFTASMRPAETKEEPPSPEPEPVAALEIEEIEQEEPEPAFAEDIQAVMAEQVEAADMELAEAFAGLPAADEEVDPMLWLDSLAARPGQRFDAFDLDLDVEQPELEMAESEFDEDFLFALSPALSPEDEVEAVSEPQESVEVEPKAVIEPPSPVPEPAVEFEPELVVSEAETLDAVPVSSGDDPLGGIDPMLWLESLAARQGVGADELTTSADLDIPEMPEDIEIDEPGYVPFDVTGGTGRVKKETEAQAEPEPVELEPEVVPEPAFESMPVAAEPEPESVADLAEAFAAEALEPEHVPSGDEGEGALLGADPMTWLESLAKRQGAKVEELTTSADIDIPEMPEDTVIDEPGYVEYSPFGTLAFEEEEPPALTPVEAKPLPEAALSEELEAVPQAESVDDSLSWLEDLAAEPEIDVADLLAFEEEFQEITAPADAPRLLDDMSDEEIAYAQAHGQLTPEQEKSWLLRQAAKLAEMRESQELDAVEIRYEAIAPAEPSELPDWLQDIRDEAEQEEAQAADLLVGDRSVPAESVEELPDWLEKPITEDEPVSDTAEVSLDADVDTLWADAVEEPEPKTEIWADEDSELAAFISGGMVPDETDQLAEALDREYDSRAVGDEEEPEWYTQAVEAVSEAELEAPDTVLEEAAPVDDVPDWIKEAAQEVAGGAAADMPDWLAASAVDAEMPAWLAAAAEPIAPDIAPAAPEVELDWLPTETAEAAESELVPIDWLTVEEEPEPAPAKKVPPPVAAVPTPVAPPKLEPEKAPAAAVPIPDDAAFSDYRKRLEAAPDDHDARLGLARALFAKQQVGPSLDHYDCLIDAAQLLDDVSNDLSIHLGEHPGEPRLRRLLGDSYMRRGLLQQALEAYRDALDQL